MSDAVSLRRMSLAMFGAGFANFSILYCVQPLLPAFARAFDLGAAQASLALSVATGVIAVCVLLTSSLSDALRPPPRHDRLARRLGGDDARRRAGRRTGRASSPRARWRA
jgi:MFS family permease